MCISLRSVTRISVCTFYVNIYLIIWWVQKSFQTHWLFTPAPPSPEHLLWVRKNVIQFFLFHWTAEQITVKDFLCWAQTYWSDTPVIIAYTLKHLSQNVHLSDSRKRKQHISFIFNKFRSRFPSRQVHFGTWFKLSSKTAPYLCLFGVKLSLHVTHPLWIFRCIFTLRRLEHWLAGGWNYCATSCPGKWKTALLSSKHGI